MVNIELAVCTNAAPNGARGQRTEEEDAWGQRCTDRGMQRKEMMARET